MPIEGGIVPVSWLRDRYLFFSRTETSQIEKFGCLNERMESKEEKSMIANIVSRDLRVPIEAGIVPVSPL